MFLLTQTVLITSSGTSSNNLSPWIIFDLLVLTTATSSPLLTSSISISSKISTPSTNILDIPPKESTYYKDLSSSSNIKPTKTSRNSNSIQNIINSILTRNTTNSNATQNTTNSNATRNTTNSNSVQNTTNSNPTQSSVNSNSIRKPSSGRLQKVYNPKIERRGDRLIVCLLNITSTYARYHTIILVRDDILTLYEKETQMDPYFLTHTLSTKLITRLNTSLVVSDTPYVRQYDTGFVIMYINKNNLLKVLYKIKYTAHTRFLIIWSHLYSSSKDIDIVLASFWRRKILNVVILIDLPHHVHVYTYYPYAHGNRSRFLNVWDKRNPGFVRKGVQIYDEQDKTRNLNLHTLKCMVKTRPPDSVIYKTRSGWVLQGIGGETMKEVQRRMNFTAQIILPVNTTPLDRFGYDISPGIPQQFIHKLKHDEIDMGFGIFSLLTYDSPHLDFSQTSSEECITFAVSTNTGIHPSIWSYYIDNFDLWVWALLVGAVVAFVVVWKNIVKYVVARHARIGRVATLRGAYERKTALNRLARFQQNSSYDLIFLLALSCLLGVSNQPRRSRLVLLLRYLFAIWILFSFILGSAFQTSMGSLLTVQRQTRQIETTEEMYAQNIRIRGQPQSLRILNRSVTPDDTDKAGRLVESFVVHQGFYDEVLDSIYSDPKIGTFSARRYIQFYMANHPRLSTLARHFIHTFSSCRVRTQASPFLFAKGSPLQSRINDIVASMVESGIAEHWIQEATPLRKGPKLRDPVSRLEVRHVRGAMIILLGGLSVASLCLGAELVIKRYGV